MAYFYSIQPLEMIELCEVYEIMNEDGIEILICYDYDYVDILGDRDKDDAELVPLGPDM